MSEPPHCGRMLPAGQDSRRALALELFVLSLLASLVVLLLAPLLAGAFYIDQNSSPSLDEWSYSRQTEWHHYYPICGEQSKRQSPINIKRENVITNNQLTMRFYNYNRRVRFTIQNAHHTIKMNPIPESYSKEYGNSQTFDINTVDEPEPMGNVGPPLPIGTVSSRLQRANLAEARTHWPADHQQQQQQKQQQQQEEPLRRRWSNGGHHQAMMADSSHDAMLEDGMQQQHSLTSNGNHLASLPVTSSAAATNTDSTGKIGNSVGGDHELNNMDDNQQHHQQHHQQHQQQSQSQPQQQQQQQQRLLYDGVPMIKLDWMDDHNNEYRLHDIHFHWGTNKDNGSEHLIDGRKSAMEMHLVHIKRGLKKDQIGYNSDSVVVIGVLIESYRKSNANFNPIVNTLTSINMSDVAHVIEYSSIYDLLPNDKAKFYTYSGSLTTPPCYEVVNWIVMHERVYINAKQMEMFRNIYARLERNHVSSNGKFMTDEQPSPPGGGPVYRIMPNIRNRQPQSGRPIMASFSMNNQLVDNDMDNELSSGAAHHPPLTWLSSALLDVSLLLALRHSFSLICIGA